MTERRLGGFERDVLLAIVGLRDNAYGITIADEIGSRGKRPPSLGAVYVTLARLQRKGLISSRMGEPTPERGGRPKRLYELAAPAMRVLREAQSADLRGWETMPPLGEPA